MCAVLLPLGGYPIAVYQIYNISYVMPDFNENMNSLPPEISEKHSNIKLYEYPSIERWVVPCGRTDRYVGTDGRTGRQTDWHTDITKLIVPFCNFTNARTNVQSIGDFNTEFTIRVMQESSFPLTFRLRDSCILGQAFHYSPENAFYIFNQQIYFIIWYLLDRVLLI